MLLSPFFIWYMKSRRVKQLVWLSFGSVRWYCRASQEASLSENFRERSVTAELVLLCLNFMLCDAVLVFGSNPRTVFLQSWSSWPPVELSSAGHQSSSLLSVPLSLSSVGGTAGYSIPIRRKKVSTRFDSRYRIDFFNSIRCGGLINLPLVHWYSSSKLGVIFIVCIA